MDELLSLAMAGTQRGRGGLQDPLFAGLSGPPENQLLGAAALAAIAGLAGRAPEAGAAIPPDDRRDDRPLAPDRHLVRILGGEFRAALPEWLELCQLVGKRPHPLHLPQLLDIGLTDKSLRMTLSETVLGPRGLWLARHNPRWAYFVAEEGEVELWETGAAALRFEALARLRGREAAHARSLLLSSWNQEGADDRLKALQVFEKNLSMEDEEFLESALDDRSKGVRFQAAKLLARLPLSRLAQRWRARVDSWVVIRPGQLEVQAPDHCSSAMLRDGIEPKSPRRDLGERAWWLQQAISMTPLACWPLELVEAASKNEWSAALGDGLADAAQAQGDQVWAEALLASGRSDAGLFAILPPNLREELLLRRFPQIPVIWLSLHRQYSLPLAERILNWLRLRVAKEYNYAWANQLAGLGLQVPFQLGATIELDWPEESRDWSRWRASVEGLISILKFRQAMNEEMLSWTS